MGTSVSLGNLLPQLATTAFAFSATAPGTAAAVGLLCALLASHY